MDIGSLGILSGALLIWVATVHLVMAAGVRRGELVWSGRYPRLLPPPLRRRSIWYAVALLASSWLLVALSGATQGETFGRWASSIGFVLIAFLGLAGLVSLVKGSHWERLLFAPITLFGAGIAFWLTFM